MLSCPIAVLNFKRQNKTVKVHCQTRVPTWQYFRLSLSGILKKPVSVNKTDQTMTGLTE